MAKDPLFSIPFFGKLLYALGMVPAYRGSDDRSQVSKNLESLAEAAKQVAAGHVMGIFPEGKSHDQDHLALVRSGAARLALQAVAAGAQDLKIVPVGLHGEQKERFRSAVWLKLGESVDAAEWLAQNNGDEHLAMRTLTAEPNTRLKSVVLHLDEAEWQPLLDDLEALLPSAGFQRKNALIGLRRQQAAVDAINHFYRTDRPRAEAVAARVRAHSEALRAAGFDQDLRVLKHWDEFAKRDAIGHQHAIIEAVSEGVVFSTVEHSIGEADSAAILRPKLTPLQKAEVIARAFSHTGKPCDFDFFSAD